MKGAAMRLLYRENAFLMSGVRFCTKIKQIYPVWQTVFWKKMKKPFKKCKNGIWHSNCFIKLVDRKGKEM